MLSFTYLYARENDNRFYYFVCVFVPMLTLIRAIHYRSKGWHYYMVDFCYFSCFSTLYFISLDRTNEKLFRTLFLFANGALAMSVAAFRNSMVFHRLDYMISVMIHVVPMLTTLRIRWKVLP